MNSTHKIDWRGIGLYLFLAFVPTWAVHILMMRTGTRFDAMTGTDTLLVAMTMLFPALAGLIVRLVKREGFATAGLRFGSWHPYVAILLGTPVVFGLIYGLSVLFGFATLDLEMSQMIATFQSLAPDQPVPPASVLLVTTLISTLTYAPLVTAVATFGEEFGWTGYLLPKLLPLGKWRATVIYGVIWGLWHAPVIYGGYNYPGYPVAGILMMCVGSSVIGLYMTSLRLRYSSVLMTTWLHAAINTQARGVWALLVVGIHPLLGGMLGLTGLLVAGALGAWLLHRSPDQEALPALKGGH